MVSTFYQSKLEQFLQDNPKPTVKIESTIKKGHLSFLNPLDYLKATVLCNPEEFSEVYLLVQKAILKEQLHHYTCELVRVVDGDTIDVVTDLGMDIKVSQRLRLSGYDSPETWRPSTTEEAEAGKRATNCLKVLLGAQGSTLLIKTSKTGKYGRYLAQIWAMSDLEESVNSKMVAEGHTKKDTY